MSVPRFEAIYSTTSSGISSIIPSALIFFFKIFFFNSKSGGNILTGNPQLNRVFSLSSKTFKSIGALSDDIIICFFSSCKLLNVWKNSFWDSVAPDKN